MTFRAVSKIAYRLNISVKDLNPKLEDLGYIERSPDGKEWVPTEKGKPHCEALHQEGRKGPYTMLIWSERVQEELACLMAPNRIEFNELLARVEVMEGKLL